MNDWYKMLESRIEKLSCSCVCETVIYVKYFTALYFLLDCFSILKRKSNCSVVCVCVCVCMCVKLHSIAALSVPMSLTVNPEKWYHLPINGDKCWVLKC